MRLPRRLFGIGALAKFTPRAAILISALLNSATGAVRCHAQLCAQISGFNLTQNFNTLAASGTNNTSVPSEFKFVEAGSSGNLTYSADNGAATGGETYSYGSAGNSDRALGELTTNTVQSTIGACFVNNTNHVFTNFLIGYTGEQWRLGAADANIDRLDFSYSVDPDATLTTGTYVSVDELDFNSPQNTTAGTLNGNAAANRTVLGPVVITPSSPIQPEATFYIHWVPVDLAGVADDGLAIDDFSIGVVMGPGVATDYNNNNVVDAADYVIWRKRLNQAVTLPNDITPGTVTNQDYGEWRNRFGKTSGDIGSGAGALVPEPASISLMFFACTFVLMRRR
jgi:hypothetical protein